MMRTVPIAPAERATIALALALSMALCAGGCARRSPLPQQPVASAPDTAQPAATPVPAAPAAAAPADSGAAGTTPSGGRPAGNLLVSENEYQGWRYYHVYCARCHGQDALGSLDAANLRYSITEEGGVTPDSFMVIVRKGSENKEMPPFHELLDDELIRHVYAYLKARSDGRLAIGRPKRASAPP